MRYAFAGDREISCNLLKFIMSEGFNPSALFIVDENNSSHGKELSEISALNEEFIFSGKEFRKLENIRILKEMDLDYIFGIHFPYIIPGEVLKIPAIGFLNLHPAYLPYNKGWHTPSWAILDGTPYGATLHFMTEALDEGDIIIQKELPISIEDTANSLYKKVLLLEEEIFKEAFKEISDKLPKRRFQTGKGSSHNKKDLQKIQEIKLDEKLWPLELINKLRALTTNNLSELAYITIEGKKVGIKVELIEMDKELND